VLSQRGAEVGDRFQPGRSERGQALLLMQNESVAEDDSVVSALQSARDNHIVVTTVTQSVTPVSILKEALKAPTDLVIGQFHKI